MQNLLTLGALIATMMLPQVVHADTSLYARMGGTPTVTRVADQTVEAVVANPAINQSFNKVNLKRVKEKLVEQICDLGGGGCTYSGDEMKLVHKGLKIDEAQFYGLVEALRVALDANGVGTREKNELLALFAPMKRLIVEK